MASKSGPGSVSRSLFGITSNRDQIPENKCNKLIAELLDSEHDLARVTEQINNLYLYAYYFTQSDDPCSTKLKTLLYENTSRGRPLSVAKITANMSSLFEEMEIETISTGKSLDKLREYTKTQYPNVSHIVMETARNIGGNPDNASDDKTHIVRAAATTKFDNPWKWPNQLSIESIVGGSLNKIRVYDDPFPKSATIYIQGTERSIESFVDNIIEFIKQNPTSTIPFTETELTEIKIELADFIKNTEKHTFDWGLLMISRNMRYGDKRETTITEENDTRHKYCIAIQIGQVTLNTVTETCGLGKKRNSCLPSLSSKPPPILSESIIFDEENINLYMKRFFAGRGKLNGDGVTIDTLIKLNYPSLAASPAASSAASGPSELNGLLGLLSIDWFCNARYAISAGPIVRVVSLQQKPSMFAGTGIGFISTGRNTMVMKSKDLDLKTVSQDDADAKARAKEAAKETAKKAATARLVEAFNSIQTKHSELEFNGFNNLVNKLFGINPVNYIQKPPSTAKASALETDDVPITLDDSIETINKLEEFSIRYDNAIYITNGITASAVSKDRMSRQMALNNTKNADKAFEALSSFEYLIEEFNSNGKDISRFQIVYTIITCLFAQSSDTIEKFIKYIFGDSGNAVAAEMTIFNYIEMYEVLLTKYNELNETDKPGEDYTQLKLKLELKLKLRKNLVILKYLLRALATFAHFISKKQELESESQSQSQSYDTAPQFTLISSPPLRKKIRSNNDDGYLKISLSVLLDNLSGLSDGRWEDVYANLSDSYQYITSNYTSASNILSPAKSPGAKDNTPNGDDKTHLNDDDPLFGLIPISFDEEFDDCDAAPSSLPTGVSASKKGGRGGSRTKKRTKTKTRKNKTRRRTKK